MESLGVPLPDQVITLGDWLIEPELNHMVGKGQIIKLEPRAMRVLVYLTENAGRTVPVAELLKHAWPDVVVGQDSVYQAVALLRRRLGDDPRRPSYIAFIPRKGYRLVAALGANRAAVRPGEVGVGPDEPSPHAARTAAASPAERSPHAAQTAGAGPAEPSLRPAQTASGSLASPTGSSLVFVAVAFAVVIGAAAAAYNFSPRTGSWSAAPAAATVPSALAKFTAASGAAQAVPAKSGAAAVDAPAAAAAAEDNRPVSEPASTSIAVLPFLDLSEKRDLGFLADGMTEELIDTLAHVSSLRVPARTSSFYFKGKAATVGDIARQLNVTHLLEGSIRRSGKVLRVTVQLIGTDNGYHLWSETYDRELADVLALEDDIARHIAGTLEAKLNSGAAQGSSVEAAAHALLLECRFYVQRNTAADARKSVDCFRRLVGEAPASARAWAGYADALIKEPILLGEPIEAQRAGALAAVKAAQRALALDPKQASAHATLSNYLRLFEHDWGAAQREIQIALAADPADPPTLLSAASLARELGHFDEFFDYCERTRVRDPLNFSTYARLGAVYLYLGRLAEAEAADRKRLDMSPEGLGGHTQLADVFIAQGNPAAALAEVAKEANPLLKWVGFALAYHALGRRAEADAALSRVAEYENRSPATVAEVYAFRGDVDRALALLSKAVDIGDPDAPGLVNDNYFLPLHPDGRYRALVARLGLPD